MKILDTDNFVSERIKVKPVTNAEWDGAKKELEKIKPNPFGLTKKDLTGKIENFPMGVVVRMMEETEKQGNTPDVKVFQKNREENDEHGGFWWASTEDKKPFWNDVINGENFEKFFEKYPEYRIYNLD